MRSDPRQPRFLTWASLRWMLRHRAWTRPGTWCGTGGCCGSGSANPHVVLRGMVFLGQGRGAQARAGLRAAGDRPVGAHRRRHPLRCHEGSLRIGDKVGVRQGEHDQLLPRRRDRRGHDRRRLGVRHRLRPPLPPTCTCRSRTRASSSRRCGSGRRLLARGQGRRCCAARGSGAAAVLGAHAVVRGDVPEYSDRRGRAGPRGPRPDGRLRGRGRRARRARGHRAQDRPLAGGAGEWPRMPDGRSRAPSAGRSTART